MATSEKTNSAVNQQGRGNLTLDDALIRILAIVERAQATDNEYRYLDITNSVAIFNQLSVIRTALEEIKAICQPSTTIRQAP